MITQQELHELLFYKEENGDFTWKKKRRGVRTGLILGTCNGFGYLRITVLGRSYYAHRLAWFYVNGEWPITIDHIDGNRGNNSIENLRSCTQIDNNQNTHGPSSRSKTQILGVSWHKKAKKWQAHICIYKERKYLGLFDNVFEAQKAYLIEKEKVKCLYTKS